MEHLLEQAQHPLKEDWTADSCRRCMQVASGRYKCDRPSPDGSTALVRALTWVLLAARGHAALEADLLAAAIALDGVTLHRLGGHGALAVGFGHDLVTHLVFL